MWAKWAWHYQVYIIKILEVDATNAISLLNRQVTLQHLKVTAIRHGGERQVVSTTGKAMCEGRVNWNCLRLSLGHDSEAGDDGDPQNDLRLHIFLDILTGPYGGLNIVGPAMWCDVEPGVGKMGFPGYRAPLYLSLYAE